MAIVDAPATRHNRWKHLLLFGAIFAVGVGVGLVVSSVVLSTTGTLLSSQQYKKNPFNEQMPTILASSGSQQLLSNNMVAPSSAPPSSQVDYKHSDWCPIAQCPNSDLCRPCRRRFLIIIATARSASTTLTYMLDSLPGVRMSGENNDTLKYLRQLIENIRTVRNFIKSVDTKSPWGHNHVPAGAFACSCQQMIETINPPLTTSNGTVLHDDAHTIVGFKTVRFLKNIEEEEIPSLVEWVKEMFPCARFVINIRSNLEAQADSIREAFGKYMSEKDLINDLRWENNVMRRVAELFGPKQSYLLDSSDWVNDLEHLNRLIAWLGFHESCAFKELLEFNTEIYGNGRTRTKRNPNCCYVGN